ncbi:hypothetical protein [Sodalis sp. RH20]|uniref:hypothetical protein n=1 Tax=unclassified Sodalis (in: enterobacteria) TaxID=2636512 RepID=UPI0039B6CEF8
MSVTTLAVPARTDTGAVSFPGGKCQPAGRKAAHRPSLAKQNENVANYLQVVSRQGKDDGAQIESLINRVIDCLPLPGECLAGLTRVLLRNTGEFGAQPGENLSVDYQLRQVKSWVAGNVLNGTVDNFIAQIILNAGAGKYGEKPRRAIDIAGLNRKIDQHFAMFKTLTVASVKYIFSHIIVPVMPTLDLPADNAAGKMNDIGDIDWVYLHAGTQFAQEMHLDVGQWSRQALSSLGLALEAMLLSDTVSPGLIRFFIRPACIYFLVNKTVDGKPVNDRYVMDDPAVRRLAVEQFFDDSRLLKERNNPFNQFSEAMRGYRTRTQLAEDILHQRCAPEATGHYAVDVESYKNNHDEYSCLKNSAGANPLIELLPDINELFRKQNQHIVDCFRAVDVLTLAEAFATLSPTDLQLLKNNTVKVASAHFSAYDQYRGVLGAHTIPRSTYIIPLSASAVLFSTTGADEHIFALDRRDTSYGLKRIDRDPRHYYALLDDITPRKDQDYVLKIIAGASEAAILKKIGQQLDDLILSLSRLAQDDLRLQLDKGGYDATTQEKVLQGITSLVPLHDCISGIIAQSREAVVPCLFDVFSLMPLLGKAGSLVSRMALKGGIGTAGAVRISLASYAARMSLTEALTAGARHFVRHAMVPAAGELSQKALISLAVDLARFADPAMVEVMFHAGAAVNRRLVVALKTVAGFMPDIAPILPKLDVLAHAGGNAVKPVVYKTARLKGTQRYFPIIPLNGDTYRRKTIYLLVDSRSGEASGIKYTLTRKNELVRVPKKAAVNLKNILQEGLGGKGSGRAARVWNTQLSYDDLIVMSLPQYPNPQYLQIESYGSREAETILFPEHGIPLQQTPLERKAYIEMFNALPNNQKLAMRVWSLIEGDKTRYHDGQKNLAQIGLSPINAEINVHLHQNHPVSRWDHAEKMVFMGLLDAIASPLPRQAGEYLRVAEYQANQVNPWGDSLGPGEIVTNFPALMSVSSQDTYARLFTEQTAEEAAENQVQTLIYYKIKDGATCLPLPYPIASTVVTEQEYLYAPRSFFRVESVSSVTLVGGEMYPAKRVAVVLREISQPVAAAKNLFTGKTIHFDLPGAP